MKKIKNSGSSFESFLDEEGLLGEVDQAAQAAVARFMAREDFHLIALEALRRGAAKAVEDRLKRKKK